MSYENDWDDVYDQLRRTSGKDVFKGDRKARRARTGISKPRQAWNPDNRPEGYDPIFWRLAQTFERGAKAYGVPLSAGLPVIYGEIKKASDNDDFVSQLDPVRKENFLDEMIHVYYHHVWNGENTTNLLSDFIGINWEGSVTWTRFKLGAENQKSRPKRETKKPATRLPAKPRRPKPEEPTLTLKYYSPEEREAKLARFRKQKEE